MMTTFYGYLEAAYLFAPYLTGLSDAATQSQFTAAIDASRSISVQVERTIVVDGSVPSQISRLISQQNAIATQIENKPEASVSINTQMLASVDADAVIPTQFSRIVNATENIRSQFLAEINATHSLRTQWQGKVDSQSSIPGQFQRAIYSDVGINSQALQHIDTARTVQAQFDRRIDSSSAIQSQFQRAIYSDIGINSQVLQHIDTARTVQVQYDRRIDTSSAIRSQFHRAIYSSVDTRSQQLQKISTTAPVRSQFHRSIANTKSTRSEFGRGPISHAYCDGYLIDPYLRDPYLAPFICAHMHAQFNVVTGHRINTQILHAVYNTTNLRILSTFPSRGNAGANWSVVAGGTAAGDFSINNLNSDIVEQVYRSNAKVIAIQCDTEISQGVFNDTLAILNHNFTTSAIVTMQGSNDPSFSSVGISENLPVELENIYWISEHLPQNSYRYWRFTVNDTTNANNLQIGTIVFGSSIIFNGECFIDDVVRRKTHFADRVRTEGYSAVSNDRALKRSVTLAFRKLDFNRDNYQNLSGVIDYARTSLKCLWIPTPQFASRFAVFGKLSEIPAENHKALGRDADYIDLDITVDEAL